MFVSARLMLKMA